MKDNTVLKYALVGMITTWLLGIGLGVFCTMAVIDLQSRTQAPDAPQEQTSQIWRVTAYCPCKLCCGRHSDGITASGHKILAGDKLIAAPRSIPFGTWITVVGYGYAEVLDRGGAIKGRRLDVFFDDKDGVSGHQRALNWGIKYIKINIDNLQ